MRPIWLPFALTASIALGLADYFVRQAAPRLSNSLGVFIYGLTTAILAAIWLAWDASHGRPATSNPEGLIYGIAVGLSFFALTALLYHTFSLGAEVSLASPLIRFGGIVVASALGIFLLREGLSIRYAAGILLTAAGLALILTR